MNRTIIGFVAAAVVLGLILLAGSSTSPIRALIGSGVFALLSLLAAVAGLIFGFMAMRTARRLRQDVDRVAISLDGALKTLASIGSRNTSTIEELTDAVNRDIGRLSERLDRADGDQPIRSAPSSDNVVALPSMRRASVQRSEPREAETVVPTGPVEIHLEPIVSVSDSAATGFEAYAGFRLANGEEHLTRRLSDLVPAKERVRFELSLFDAVVTASRRQLGGNGRDIPIHVAVSRAFIEDARASTRVLELFRLHPGLEGQIVLSLAELPPIASSAAFAKMIAKLRQAGAQFALEAAPENDGVMAEQAAAGITYLKLNANRLLDRERGRSPRLGADVAHLASVANVAIIASGVSSDEDVLALMDIGVDLMSGPRFSAPRRLKPLAAAPASAAKNNG